MQLPSGVTAYTKIFLSNWVVNCLFCDSYYRLGVALCLRIDRMSVLSIPIVLASPVLIHRGELLTKPVEK